jgi:hypothetical protein
MSARCRVFKSAASARRCWPTRTIACARKGYPLTTVQSWSTSEGANKLYHSAVLLPKDEQLNWIKFLN